MKNRMQRFKIRIAYDGTDYHGWQVQLHGNTIADCLQRTFYRIFGFRITLLGSSRTDSGVHALGQVARFQTDFDISPKLMHAAWNNGLPQDIRILDLVLATPSFHPMANVTKKIYYYHLFIQPPLPFVARYGWFYEYIDQIDLAFFEKVLNIFVGEHDFGSFCKVEKDTSTTRTIDSIALQKFCRFGMLQVIVRGKSFLRFQIRRMIGAALDVACRKERSLSDLQHILDNPCSRQTLLKAEAKGLCLRKIMYQR